MRRWSVSSSIAALATCAVLLSPIPAAGRAAPPAELALESIEAGEVAPYEVPVQRHELPVPVEEVGTTPVDAGTTRSVPRESTTTRGTTTRGSTPRETTSRETTTRETTPRGTTTRDGSSGRSTSRELVPEELTPDDPGPAAPTPVDPGPPTPVPEPIDPGPVAPVPEDPAPADPVPEDPAPADPAPADPAPVDPEPEPATCPEGYLSVEDLIFTAGTSETFDLELTTICATNVVFGGDGSIGGDIRARLRGPNGLDVLVEGPAKIGGLEVLKLDLRGHGAYSAANFAVQGTVHVTVDKVGDPGRLEVSGALVTSTAHITGDVTGAVQKTGPGEYSLDLSGQVTYQKGNLRVTGTITDTYLTGHTEGPNDLPTDVDPDTIWGKARVRGTVTLGKITGLVDVLLERDGSGDPYFGSLTVTGVDLGGGIELDRLHLGNTQAAPTNVAVDAQLSLPKVLFEALTLTGTGSVNTADGTFDLKLHGDDSSTPWLGLFWRWGMSSDITLTGTTTGATLRGTFGLGAVSPILASHGGGQGVLTASYTYATGALEGGISVDASACVLLCTVVQGSASVRIDVDGNVKEEWIDIKGHGRGSATTVLLWGFGNGYFNIDARLDLSGPDLTFSGRASWSMKAKTWWGLKNIVDDWMDVSFDHDRVTIVAGQQWRKRERIKNLRGELYPVKRVCGDYWFKHNTPWDDYDFRGYWGDCDEHGNVPIGTVTGEVRIDSDRSGTVTDADAPVAGQVVVVERTDGTVVGKGRTDSAGRYSIRVTAGSNLRLKLDPMVAGHDKGSVWPASVSVTNGGATDVGSALLRVLTFGSATGTAFHDVNDNGERDAGEPGVAGVRVVVKALYGSAETRTVTTDATGRWTVGGLDDRYSYQAELTGTGGFWVRDDPYRIDEHLVWVHPGAEEPVESPAVALIDEDLPDGGARIEGRVTILASCSGSSYDPFGPMPSYSYAYAGYDRSCDPYGMPYETTPTGADDIIVHLSTGHISRADAWSGQFSMSGVPVGTHRYWVSTPQGYADGEVTVDAEGQTVWLNPRVGR